jgi:hypothetical protein
MHAAARQHDTVLADRALPTRMTPKRLAVRAQDVRMHNPERWPVKVAKTAGWPITDSGTPLPPPEQTSSVAEQLRLA